MKLPKFISQNLIFKITSLNAVVISTRLLISLAIQRYITTTFGEAGHALIGQIRNIIPMLTSSSTLGVFNGVVKYVAQSKEDKKELGKLFSTVFVFFLIGTLITSIFLFFYADTLALKLFDNTSYAYIIEVLALIVPFIGIHRIFYGVINGVSDYKNYAKVDLIGYLLGALALLYGIWMANMAYVLLAIAITPVFQVSILLIVFGKKLKEIIPFKRIDFGLIYKNKLLSFTIMSLVSTVLVNYVEIDLRTYLIKKLSINEAGYWTGVTSISKNYMVFATGLFSLYILPKFASINKKNDFYRELIHIYKTVLPIFGAGMLLVFFLRFFIIDLIYPGFYQMEGLFKWQLIGDFVRLSAMIMAHQFLAKRMVKSFVFTELLSTVLFYILSIYFVKDYGTEGIVLAHFVRYVIYFVVVAILVWKYFNDLKIKSTNA